MLPLPGDEPRTVQPLAWSLCRLRCSRTIAVDTALLNNPRVIACQISFLRLEDFCVCEI